MNRSVVNPSNLSLQGSRRPAGGRRAATLRRDPAMKNGQTHVWWGGDSLVTLHAKLLWWDLLHCCWHRNRVRNVSAIVSLRVSMMLVSHN
jgi:hypothetical protein